MRLSVLIVNWNTRELLARCLESVFASTFEGGLEVIVVDNASSDGSAEMVRERFPHAVFVASSTNTGYARGNNLAFERASGTFLLTLNPDTEFEPDLLQKAVDRIEQMPNFGVLAPKLVGIDSETQASVRGFPTLLGILGDLSGLGRRFPGSRLDSYRLTGFDYTKSQEAPQPMGTFLLFRKVALDAIGDSKKPFDEGFPIFFNEVDLLFRLRQAGWPCWFESSLSIRHLGGASTRQVRKPMIWESHRSLVRYLRKHAVTPWNFLLFPLFSLAVLAAAFIRARGYHAGFRP